MSGRAILLSGDNDEEAFCYKCVKDFDEAGGCECMANNDCDQLSLIPEGCFICGQYIAKYCDSKIGKKSDDIEISQLCDKKSRR